MFSPRFTKFVALSLLLARFTVAEIDCPEDDGIAYTDEATGSTFIVECGTERPGGDLQGTGPAWVSSLEDCIGVCAANQQCVNVVYVPGTPGPCYIKSTLTLEELAGELIGAHRLDVEGYRCPEADGTVVQVNPDSKWTLRCSWNYQGDGAAASPILTTTFDKCIAKCETIDDCNFATFYAGQGLTEGSVVRNPGGKCTFHKTVTQASEPIEGAWGGLRYSVCPDEDGTMRTVGDTSYKVECETDRYGNDIGEPVFTDSYTSCLGECNDNPDCVAVVWRHKTRACYLKNNEGIPVIAPGNIAGSPDKCAGSNKVATSTTTVAGGTVTVTEGSGKVTVTQTVTPVTYYPLLTLDQTSTPTPVPTSHGGKKCGNAKCYNGKNSCAPTSRHYPKPTNPPRFWRRSPTGEVTRSTTETVCTATSTTVVTVSTATTTTTTLPGGTCTTQVAAATTTVAAVCQPSLAYNKAALPAPIATAVSQGKVKNLAAVLVDDKMSCCDECVDTLNCVYWKWAPDSALNPSGSPALPGNCVVGYYAANNLGDLCKKRNRKRFPGGSSHGGRGRGGARGRENDDDEDTVLAAICPNGGFVTEGAVSVVNWGTAPSPADAYTGTGFNPGPCGGAEGLWDEETSDGVPPGSVNNCAATPA